VIVAVDENGEEVREVMSLAEKRVRLTGDTASENGSPKDMLDRQYENHLNIFYDKVIAILRDTESILIFGPGEAKRELEKRLTGGKANGHILAVESADKMTDPQIVAKVRQRLLE
jgi:hypothetical protein